ncbi:DUF7573 domain-containing protein [Natronocalculus amylovorans]|uniref:DUF7573 domain-containing protein n=1 Tax=Natronocalculus amylovorans TaxID=2917812 RepID=A0AAE3FWM4_9EURY|nr:hypothetical protein [Natronocalculus amylovorans]MCL9816525.1 hypothetical protein [Natronocalculus amylovorans]NUE00971.1 hypothetical protein [Halorubraceae archaeon YAN]
MSPEKNRSLDEFAAPEESPVNATSNTDAVDNSPSATTDMDTEQNVNTSPTETTAAIATYRWSPDGVACDQCGAVVQRQWRDDGSFVCASCKDW